MPKFESDVVTIEMLTDEEACSVGGNLPENCYIDYPYERPDRDKPKNKAKIMATLMGVLALPLASDVREQAEARMAMLRQAVDANAAKGKCS